MDSLQTGLDFLGLAPGIGEPFDLANAGISLARGRPGAAALSAAAAAPFIGWGATGAKFGSRAFKGGDDMMTVFRGVRPNHPGFKDATKGIAKPRRPFTGHTNTLKHNLGDTRSKFISTTSDRNIAKQFSGEKGIIIETQIPKSKLIPTIDKYNEKEFLIKGVLKGKVTKP